MSWVDNDLLARSNVNTGREILSTSTRYYLVTGRAGLLYKSRVRFEWNGRPANTGRGAISILTRLTITGSPAPRAGGIIMQNHDDHAWGREDYLVINYLFTRRSIKVFRYVRLILSSVTWKFHNLGRFGDVLKTKWSPFNTSDKVKILGYKFRNYWGMGSNYWRGYVVWPLPHPLVSTSLINELKLQRKWKEIIDFCCRLPHKGENIKKLTQLVYYRN